MIVLQCFRLLLCQPVQYWWKLDSTSTSRFQSVPQVKTCIFNSTVNAIPGFSNTCYWLSQPLVKHQASQLQKAVHQARILNIN